MGDNQSTSVETTQETPTRTKFCKYCGAKIPEQAVICTHCGGQVEKLKAKSRHSRALSSIIVTQVPTQMWIQTRILTLMLLVCITVSQKTNGSHYCFAFFLELLAHINFMRAKSVWAYFIFLQLACFVSVGSWTLLRCLLSQTLTTYSYINFKLRNSGAWINKKWWKQKQ